MDYATKREQLYTRKLRELTCELPEFCGTFFKGIESSTSALTRHGYAVDLKTFFEYLAKDHALFQQKPTNSITLDDLKRLTAVDIENYLGYISFYSKNESELVNRDKAKKRKLSALRSMYRYLLVHSMVDVDVALLVEQPKLHDNAIIRLEANEVADLLDVVESGQLLSNAENQKKYHEFMRTRDTALFAMFLGTGIRISEFAGLDITDFDFGSNSFKVTRKGGDSMILYFNSEVADALKSYLARRADVAPLSGHDKAMFLSKQGKRMTPRAIQNLVKKYTTVVAPLKNISPHKLRSTFGTMLYQETGDIYLVADVLGHKDVNTTRKHYAATTDENRRRAAKAVKLRED